MSSTLRLTDIMALKRKMEHGTDMVGELIGKVDYFVYENLYPKECDTRVETSETSTRRPLRGEYFD